MPENIENNQIPISFVHVMPKNFKYCHYSINGLHFHTKNYAELGIYLTSIMPVKMQEILKLLGEKKHFLMFIEENRIEGLAFDLQKEREELAGRNLHENLNTILIKEKEKKNPNTMDGRIKDISRIDITKTNKKNDLKKLLNLDFKKFGF